MIYSGRCFVFVGDYNVCLNESEWLMDTTTIDLSSTPMTGIASIDGVIHNVYHERYRIVAIPLSHAQALEEPTRLNVMMALRTEQIAILSSISALMNTQPNLLDAVIKHRLAALMDMHMEQCFAPGEQDLARAWEQQN